MIASLADGKSEISGFLEGEDCLATIQVFQKMGVNISKQKGKFIVEGRGLRGLKKPNSPLDFRISFSQENNVPNKDYLNKDNLYTRVKNRTRYVGER